MANLNINLSGALQVYDTTNSGSVVIVNRAIALVYAATVQYFNAFEQINGATSLALPAAIIYVASVVNKSGVNMTVGYTPVTGANGVCLLGPGGQWVYFNQTAVGGLAAIALTPASGIASAEVLMAA